MSTKTLIFMGTSEFAVPILMDILGWGYNTIMVYTGPDGRGGRGQKEIVSPVKKIALERSLPLRQPESLKTFEEKACIRELNPDIIIVAAYGLILPGEVLNLPRFRCINVHPSLLPRHRGPSPIAATILAGDKDGGVSIMVMDEGVDTGPVLRQQRCVIDIQDTAETLTSRLAQLGGALLVSLLPEWFEGKIRPVPQDHSKATYSKIIRKEDGEIDWQQNTAKEIWLKIRAFYPWPGCYTRWKGKLLKIVEADPIYSFQHGAGEVIEVNAGDGYRKKDICIGTREGVLRLKMVQYEGKRVMGVEEFTRGHRDFLGYML